MIKHFPSFRRREEKSPLLERPKIAQSSDGEDWFHDHKSSSGSSRTTKIPVPFILVRNVSPHRSNSTTTTSSSSHRTRHKVLLKAAAGSTGTTKQLKKANYSSVKSDPSSLPAFNHAKTAGQTGAQELLASNGSTILTTPSKLSNHLVVSRHHHSQDQNIIESETITGKNVSIQIVPMPISRPPSTPCPSSTSTTISGSKKERTSTSNMTSNSRYTDNIVQLKKGTTSSSRSTATPNDECKDQYNSAKGKAKYSNRTKSKRSFKAFLSRAAAIIIQTCYRRFTARLQYNYNKYSGNSRMHHSILLDNAAEDQQRWIYYRSTGNSPKAHAYYSISSIVESAAILIQRIWRGYSMRSSDAMEKQIQCWIQHNQQDSACFNHQNVHYYYHYYGGTKSQEQFAAAVAIQRVWRGYNATRNFHLYFVLISIQRMQTFVRRCLAYKKFRALLLVSGTTMNSSNVYRSLDAANDTLTFISDDNDSFDIREADELWLDSFDSIVDHPPDIRALSLMSLHPIQEGDDETETQEPLHQQTTSAKHASPLLHYHHSTTKNSVSPTINDGSTTHLLFHCQEVSSCDDGVEYDDPPLYFDDVSEASTPYPCSQLRGYSHLQEEHHNISISTPFYIPSEVDLTAFISYGDKAAAEHPVSPPQITRIIETSDDLGIKRPFVRNNISTPIVFHPVTCSSTSREQPIPVVQNEHTPHFTSSLTLHGIASKYREKTRGGEHRRNLSDGSRYYDGTGMKSSIGGVAVSDQQNMKALNLRTFSESALHDVSHQWQQQGQKKNLVEDSILTPSIATSSVSVMPSESPTSIITTSRLTNDNDGLRGNVHGKPSTVVMNRENSFVAGHSKNIGQKNRERLHNLKWSNGL